MNPSFRVCRSCADTPGILIILDNKYLESIPSSSHPPVLTHNPYHTQTTQSSPCLTSGPSPPRRRPRPHGTPRRSPWSSPPARPPCSSSSHSSSRLSRNSRPPTSLWKCASAAVAVAVFVVEFARALRVSSAVRFAVSMDAC